MTLAPNASSGTSVTHKVTNSKKFEEKKLLLIEEFFVFISIFIQLFFQVDYLQLYTNNLAACNSFLDDVKKVFPGVFVREKENFNKSSNSKENSKKTNQQIHVVKNIQQGYTIYRLEIRGSFAHQIYEGVLFDSDANDYWSTYLYIHRIDLKCAEHSSFAFPPFSVHKIEQAHDEFGVACSDLQYQFNATAKGFTSSIKKKNISKGNFSLIWRFCSFFDIDLNSGLVNDYREYVEIQIEKPETSVFYNSFKKKKLNEFNHLANQIFLDFVEFIPNSKLTSKFKGYVFGLQEKHQQNDIFLFPEKYQIK